MNSKFNQLINTNKHATNLEKVSALYEDQKIRVVSIKSRGISFALRCEYEANLQHSEQTIARMEMRSL